MKALKRLLFVCCGVATLVVAAPAESLRADDDGYWRRYWHWYDGSYSPYYQRRFSSPQFRMYRHDRDWDDWEDARDDWEDRLDDRRERLEDLREDRRDRWEDWREDRWDDRWQYRGYRGGPIYDGYGYPYGRPYYRGNSLRVGPLWLNWR